VVPLTIPEIIMLKAAEFAELPLLYLPVGLVVATVTGVGVKTGIVKSFTKNGKGAVEEEKEEGNGEYRVEVKKGSNTIHDEDGLIMEWLDGPSTLWVYA
jgi:hypothetical protein